MTPLKTVLGEIGMRLEKIHRSTKPFPDDLNQLRAGLNWQYLQFKNNSDDGKIFKTGLVIDLVMRIRLLIEQ